MNPYRSNFFVITLLSLAVAILSMPALSAQDQTPPAQEPAGLQEPTKTSLDLSSDIQSAGSEVVLTLSLSTPSGVEVGKAVSEVTYPPKLLVFQEVRRGLSAEAVGAEVKADNKPADAENSVLTVTITAKEGDFIPPGMLADLVFVIAKDAPQEKLVPLKNKVSAWTAKTPPTAIAEMTGKDGEVQITATPPVFACFFYMH